MTHEEAFIALPSIVARLEKVEAKLAKLESENKRAPALFTVKEAAEALRCSTDKVYAYVREGLLSRIGTSRHIRIPRESLEEFKRKTVI